MGHSLDGCYAKLERAQESLNYLSDTADGLFSTDAYRLIRAPQGAGEYVIRFHCPDRLPLRFAVLSGEIVHNLRSSLDHLVTALVLANDRPFRRASTHSGQDSDDASARCR